MSANELQQAMLSRWLKFMKAVGESGIQVRGNTRQVFATLDRHYSEDHRYYHDWVHISACLDELQKARFSALHPAAVEMAVWFHDVVYIPGAPDNEKRSAQIARNAAESMGLPSGTVLEVANLILATRYQSDEDTPEELCNQDRALIRDIDLSILGKSREEFDRYEEAIRREYSDVPERERWQRRIGVLKRFLALPKIYETEQFQTRYERQARQNLSRSVSRLRKLLAG
jgi:predicted metal-dependent HD superfamily phosphohydrolase